MAGIARIVIVGGGIFGVGYGLYRTTVPTEAQLLEKFSPEIKQRQQQESQLREIKPQDSAKASEGFGKSEEEQLYDIIQSNANSSRPIWMLNDTPGLAPSTLKENDRVKWSQEAKRRARENARLRMVQEQERLDNIESTSKKSWWH
ncbi:uncharacterized protein V1516DRAFT_673986 [Lipomyces oligophaga]|uniref:uncharacterized protein n=1 Tax=Lipomyces oligophaga TaxID=45792 RepID=UPI0034CD87AF